MNWITQDLIALGVVEFGSFTLASGEKSDYYFDLKKALCNPKFLECAAQEINSIINSADELKFPSLYAGVAVGAVPIAVACALDTLTPYIIVRTTPKDHGTKKSIEGPFKPGQTVILVEDVTTTGGSSMKAVSILRSEGLVVRCIVTIIDREQGAGNLFISNAIPFKSLTTGQELLKAARK